MISDNGYACANERESHNQVQQKCQHLGYADVFMSTNNDIILRQEFLHRTLLQHEFYFASKGTGTHSVRLTPIEYKNHTYMRMDGVNYQNTQVLIQENDQYTDKLVKSDENKTGVYVGHKHLLSKRQLDQLDSTNGSTSLYNGSDNDNRNDHDYEYIKSSKYGSIVDNTALDTTKKTRSLLTNIKDILIPCYKTR